MQSNLAFSNTFTDNRHDSPCKSTYSVLASSYQLIVQHTTSSSLARLEYNIDTLCAVYNPLA